MSDTSGPDWAGERGERWREHHVGLEATIEPIHGPLFEALRLDGPARVAEVGCGCGGTALALSRHAPEGTVVHGYDLSPANVEEARGRADEAGREVSFQVADMSTARPEEPYDRLLSRFGFMFFEDPVPAFRNLADWLAPGGRLAFATWGVPTENLWMVGVFGAVRELVEVPETDPDGPGPFRYGEVDRLLGELGEAGFQDLEVSTWRGKLALGGGLAPPDAARFALSAFGGLSKLLSEAGEEVAAEAHSRVTAVLSEAAPEGVVRMDASVHVVTGGR
jgi:SAM-dependent methyltransferase